MSDNCVKRMRFYERMQDVREISIHVYVDLCAELCGYGVLFAARYRPGNMAPVSSRHQRQLEEEGHTLQLYMGMYIWMRKKKLRTHRWWVRDIFQRRHQYGTYYTSS
jgi:hypothetical protein